jgi:hypothetical protein
MDVDERGMSAARHAAAALIAREDGAAQRRRDGLFCPRARLAVVAGVMSPWYCIDADRLTAPARSSVAPMWAPMFAVGAFVKFAPTRESLLVGTAVAKPAHRPVSLFAGAEVAGL